MCGLFGFVSYGKKDLIVHKNRLANALAIEAATRGKHATGVAYNLNGQLIVNKAPVEAALFDPEISDDVRALIGHTRHATQGKAADNYNNHPFPGEVNGVHYALAHNGVLWNDTELRKELNLPQTEILTDSYIANQLLETKSKLDMNAMKYVGETVSGSFTFSILDENNNLYFVRGSSPLTIYHFKKLKLYVYASTPAIIDDALAKTDLAGNKDFEVIDTKEGELIKIRPTGIMKKSEFTSKVTSYYAKDWYDYKYDYYNDDDDYYKSYNNKYNNKYADRGSAVGTNSYNGVYASNDTKEYKDKYEKLLVNLIFDDIQREFILKQVYQFGYSAEDIYDLMKRFGLNAQEIEEAVSNYDIFYLIEESQKIAEEEEKAAMN